jgi:peptidoglycan L-alanyl-D-glutamate endopeptidase CwlK
MDTISEARLSLVWPGLSDKIHQLATMLEPEGFSYRVTQGLRTWQEQDALYAQGRTTPGKIVTNAQGGYSWHCLGVAVDLCPNTVGTADGEFVPDWDVSHPAYARMIAVGESLGLTSGSTFVSLPDIPHFQYTNPYPVDAPNDEARSIYINEGATAFWSTLV